MYYDELIESKIPAFYIWMNSKAEIAYDQVFIQINEILTFGIKNLNFWQLHQIMKMHLITVLINIFLKPKGFHIISIINNV